MNLDYFLNSWKPPTCLKNVISYLNYDMFGNIFKNQKNFDHSVKWDNSERENMQLVNNSICKIMLTNFKKLKEMRGSLKIW